MGHVVFLCAALAVVAWDVVLAKFSIEEAGVSILYPQIITKTMPMAMADFGMPKYGAFMRGELVYPSAVRGYDANKTKAYTCSLRDCQYGCGNLNESTPPFQLQKEPRKLYIMMLDRGPSNIGGVSPCYFLDKVYYAQLAGADAVLVANDEDGELTTAVAPKDYDTAKELRALQISAAMISFADANYLRELLKSNTHVSLLLNWTRSVPEASVVTWEFWTSSQDGCGASCDERVDFIKGMKEQAQKLQKAGLANFTPRYFLWDCPAENVTSAECERNCIANGAYCELDPKNSYSGKDVLRMNLRGMCFFKLAAAANQSHLWWDYATQMAADCSMMQTSFTPDCAKTVFNAVGGPGLVADNGGLAAWDTCATVDETAETIPAFVDELASQSGNSTLSIRPVTLLPTIRIDGVQYRGSLEAGPVLRAICAGFRDGEEPAVCNDESVSEDECKEGGVGYEACMTDVAAAAGKTRCINIFGGAGYKCECKSGVELYINPLTSEERCQDLNECLATSAPLVIPECSCPRCACINKVGSYKCTGKLDNKCTAANNYGGLWQATIDREFFTACVDDVSEYKNMAARGLANETDKWFKFECPKCFLPTSDGASCEPKCDLALCHRASGFCSTPSGGGKTDGAGGDGGGGGSGGGGGGGSGDGGGGSKSSGVSAVFLVFVALASAVLTGGVVLVANRYLMRQRMGDEIRDIMSQYMPLQEDRDRNAMNAVRNTAANGGGGAAAAGGRGPSRPLRADVDSDDEGKAGAYGWAQPAPSALGASGSAAGPSLAAASQRAVWGPAPVNAFAAASASAGASAPKGSAGAAAPAAAAAAAAAARPAVDVFTISGSDDAMPLPASSAARAATGDADPLLGLNLSGSTSLDTKSAAKTSATDNPFL